MNCNKVKELIEKGIKIIDVRTPMEHNQVRIAGSENVPLDTIFNLDTEEPVAVYCRSGARSNTALQILKQRGIDAIDIGGIFNYQGCVEY